MHLKICPYHWPQGSCPNHKWSTPPKSLWFNPSIPFHLTTRSILNLVWNEKLGFNCDKSSLIILSFKRATSTAWRLLRIPCGKFGDYHHWWTETPAREWALSMIIFIFKKSFELISVTGRVSTNRRPSFHLLPYERNIVSRSSFHWLYEHVKKIFYYM